MGIAKAAGKAKARMMATAKQLDYISSLCDQLCRAEPPDIDTLTKQQASALIEELEEEKIENQGNDDERGWWSGGW